MILVATLLACSEEAEVAPTPSVAFLEPLDGATVPVGEIHVSLVVDGFALEPPAKHNEGEPAGWLELSWTDGTTSDSGQLGQVTTTLDLTTPGAWTLGATLYFADGDEIVEEFADFEPAAVALTVE